MAGSDGTATVLWVILGATLWRTFLVVDALRGRSGLVARSARRISATGAKPPSPTHQRRASGTTRKSFTRCYIHKILVVTRRAAHILQSFACDATACTREKSQWPFLRWRRRKSVVWQYTQSEQPHHTPVARVAPLPFLAFERKNGNFSAYWSARPPLGAPFCHHLNPFCTMILVLFGALWYVVHQ